MENNKNFILAMVLSLAVLFGWQAFVAGPRMEAERKTAEIEAARKANAEGKSTPGTPSGGRDNAIPSANKTAAGGNSSSVPGYAAQDGKSLQLDRKTALAASPRVEIDSKSLSGSINLKGGRIDDLHLKEYHETIDKKSPTIVLLSPKNAPGGAYFAEFGWVSGTDIGGVPQSDTLWQVKEGTKLTSDTPVELIWKNDRGLVFHRKISVDENYMFKIEDSVENTGSSSISLQSYGRIARVGKPKIAGIYVLHEGLIGDMGEEGLKEIKYKAIEEDLVVSAQPTDKGWLGITDKYWATALIPGERFTGRFAFFNKGGKQYQTDFISDAIPVEAGKAASVTNRFFAGAKQVSVIDRYEANLKIQNFSNLIDWGWFYFITKPMFKLIDWIYNLIGNFGFSILIVTVLLKILFFPLANKSYVSMANMKKMQPAMTEIRERYADDKVKQQQEMMALYKKEKINPAAGCWPMLIQIPVFFSLYKVLYVTIEMRHAPFFGWIQDLAAPDPTSVFNLFGLIPIDLPQILMVGVWPLVMGITMFLQMRMNPTPPDPTQAMIFTWMPIVFTFMLARFPAGLVIYWAWNNTLTIIQQGAIMKRQGVKVELWDNLKDLFKRKAKS